MILRICVNTFYMDIKTTINNIVNGDSIVSTRKELVDLKLQQERELKLNLFQLDTQKQRSQFKHYKEKVQFIERYYYLCDKAKVIRDKQNACAAAAALKTPATRSSLSSLPDILQTRRFQPMAFSMMNVLKNHRCSVFNTMMDAKVLLEIDDLAACRYLRKRPKPRLPPL